MPKEGRERVTARGIANELKIGFKLAERLVLRARREYKGVGELRGEDLVTACRKLLEKERGL